MVMICERCGWVFPADCTCGWRADELSRARLRGEVEHRHRESVVRAHGRRWVGAAAGIARGRRAAG